MGVVKGIIAVMRKLSIAAASLAVLLLAIPPAHASCNDLVVDLEQAPGWRIAGADCESGDVVEQSERRLEIESGLAGPDCSVKLRGPDGGASVRVQQNFCLAQAGAIAVATTSGSPPGHCSQEGSYAADRGGTVTFGDFAWHGPTLADGQLRLVTYNVFDRNLNVATDGQDRRMTRLPGALAAAAPDLDVLVVQEAFNTDVVTYGLCKLGLGHQTPVLRDPKINSIENGGVLVASRWPISRTEQHIYRDACHGADCLAAKGVVYARVEKGAAGTPYHVFGTHLQAGAEYHGDRVEQARQMRRFAVQQAIPASEPVLFAGDFNVDHLAHPERVEQIALALGSVVPKIPQGEATSDPKTNELVGQDGAAARGGCCQAYTSSHPHDCGCCPREWLDYVFVSSAHLAPRSALALERIQVQTDAAFAIQVDPFDCSDEDEATWNVRSVSDHDAVATTFR